MFAAQTKKDFLNPYKHGVLIGNYVEDIFGQDLVKKYQIEKEYSNYISETTDKFKNPCLVPNKNIRVTPQEKVKPNFDFNINFSKKTIQDIKDQIDLQDKQADHLQLSASNLSISQREKIMEKFQELPEEIKHDLKPQVEKFVNKDLVGLYFTNKTGLANHLLKGHGPNQENFKSRENISVKGLTIDKKERTDTIFNPHYSTVEKFSFPEKFKAKETIRERPKYRHYDEFTRTFDKKTNLA